MSEQLFAVLVCSSQRVLASWGSWGCDSGPTSSGQVNLSCYLSFMREFHIQGQLLAQHAPLHPCLPCPVPCALDPCDYALCSVLRAPCPHRAPISLTLACPAVSHMPAPCAIVLYLLSCAHLSALQARQLHTGFWFSLDSTSITATAAFSPPKAATSKDIPPASQAQVSASASYEAFLQVRLTGHTIFYT